MDKEKFRLDAGAKKRINVEFDRQEDLRRVNAQPRRPAPQGRPRQADSRRQSARGRDERTVRQTYTEQRRRVSRPKPALRRPVRRPPPDYIPPEPYYDDYDYEPDEPPRKRYARRRLAKLLFRVAAICIAIIFINVMFFYYRGQIWFNEPRKRDYPVRGAVVTQNLGTVDWEKFAAQNISFVYIRATKGTAVVDEQYSANRKGANHTDLLCGYYHEFDFRTDGEKQAEHFIDKLGDLDGKLRPMVRLTRYGIYRVYHKDEKTVRTQLQKFLDRVEEEYGRKCVIQCDKGCYEDYVKGSGLEDYTLWLISHFSEPDEEETNWALWEYNPRVRTAAYANKKKYYCMTVFRKEKSLNNFKKNLLM